MGRLSPWNRDPWRELRITGVDVSADAVRAASNPTAPNKLWTADLTVVRTDEGWLHFAAVLDCYTRRCRGWWSADGLQPALVSRAVEMAVARRWPAVSVADGFGEKPRDVALALGPRCRVAGLRIPNGGSRSTMDGAVAESFFAMLRRDLLDAHPWATKADAYDAIGTWIEAYYNPETTSITGSIAAELDQLSL